MWCERKPQPARVDRESPAYVLIADAMKSGQTCVPESPNASG